MSCSVSWVVDCIVIIHNASFDYSRLVKVLESQSAGRFSLYFFVKSSAFFMNFFLSLEYSSARSARRGCSGSGSSISAIREWITARQERSPLSQSNTVDRHKVKQNSGLYSPVFHLYDMFVHHSIDLGGFNATAYSKWSPLHS